MDLSRARCVGALVVLVLLLFPATAIAGDSNDAFSGAEPISTMSFSITGDNVGAGQDAGDPGNTYASVWYAWTPPQTGRVAIDVDDCDYDSYLRVYSGGVSLATMNVLAANDDAATAYCSALNVDALAGTTYYIAVGGYNSSSTGTFTLRGVTGPPNDAFASASAIATDTVSLPATTVAATSDVGEPLTTFGSIWYTWTPTQTGVVWIDTTTCQSRTIRLYQGTALATLTEVANVNGACPARVTTSVTAGTPYRIAVGHNGDVWGDPFQLRIRRAAANDAFTNATVLTGGDVSVGGATFGATDDAGEPTVTNGSVWYSWTPSTSRTVSIRTRSCTFDTFLRVYTGSTLGALTPVASNDNAEAGSCSLVRASVIAGTTYRIAAGSALPGVSGDFQLTIDAEPYHDAFADAITLTGDVSSVTSNNFGATQDVGDATNTLNSVWYRWTPGRTGTAAIHTRSCDFDSYLRVFTGTTLPSLQPVASNNDTIGTSCSAVTVEVVAGTTYHVLVGGNYATAFGEFTLRTSIAVASDSFSASTSLSAQFSQLGGFASARVRAEGATREPGEPVQAGRADLTGTTWYRFRSDRNATVTIDTVGSGGDTALGVYTGSVVTALTLIADNDDAAPGVTTSALSLAVTDGTMYYIAVAGTGISHAVRINGPVNDRFVDAQVMSGLSGSAAGTTSGSLTEDSEPPVDGTLQTGSIWYRWTAPVSQVVAIDTLGSLVPPNLAVYTGSSVSSLTLVASATYGSPRRVEFSAVAGTSYRIALSTSGQRGETKLRIDPPPASDKFASAVVVPPAGARFNGSSTGATREANEPVHGGRMGQASVWFRWVPSSAAAVRFNTNGSTYDTHLAVYQGPELASLTQIVADDDAGWGQNSQVTFTPNPGQPYYIAISSPDNARGAWQLNALAPTNDDVAEAAALAASPGTVTTSSRAATLEVGEPVHATTYGSRSLWYTWTAPFSGPVGIDTSGSTVDTVLSAWTGVPGSLVRIASNDNALGGTVSWSQLRLVVTAGTTYTFAVRDTSYAGGSVDLTVERIPPNDAFGSATNIAGARDIVTGWTTGATHQAGEPDHAGAATAASSWWKWTAPTTGPALVDTRGSDFDAVLGVYTGSAVNALTLVGADDDSLDPDARVAFAATAGTTYYFAVDGAANDRGRVMLRLNIPPNDHAFDAAPLTANVTADGSLLGATIQPGENQCSSYETASVWFAFTPPNRSVTYDTAGSSVDTTLEIYTGDPSSIATLTRKAGACGWWGSRPRLEHRTTIPGQTVYVRVATVYGTLGQISVTPRMAPANDDVDQPTTISGWSATVTGSLNYATSQASPTPACGSCPSIWYEWIAPASGPASFDTYLTDAGSYRTTRIGIWNGTVPGSETLVLQKQPPFGSHTRAVFTAVAGTRYLVHIEGAGAVTDFGNVILRVNPPAPANDAFAAAQGVSGSNVYAVGTTWGATRELPDEPNHAGAGGTRSVWYRWVAPNTQTATVNTTSNDGDTVLAVYQGASLATLTGLAANDDAEADGGSRLTFPAVNGQTYWIAVDTKAASSDFNLNISIPLPPPVNDMFTDAIPIAGGIRDTVTGTNYGGTMEPDEPPRIDNCGVYHSAWYTWTPAYTGKAVLDTIGSPFDTTLSVYRGPRPSAGYLVAANDDLSFSPHNQRSRVTIYVTAGLTYHVAVNGCELERWGAFTLRVNPPPDNDDFATPTVVTPTSWVTTTHAISATAQASEPAHAGAAASQSTWYSYTATSTGNVTLDTLGSSFDTTLAVYTGASLATLVPVASNDDAYPLAGDRWSIVTFPAVSGTTYRIAIESRDALGATAVLNLGRARNDFIQDAAVLTGRTASAMVESRHLGRQGGESQPRVLGGMGCTAWFTWVAPGNGLVTMDTFASWVSDSAIDVYTGPLDTTALTLVAGNDTTLGSHARVRFAGVIGTPYRIRVESGFCEANNSSPIGINIVQQPPHDNLAAAIPVTAWSTSVSESSVEATKEVDEPNHGTAPTGASVWYDWTPPSSGAATLTLFGSSFDTALGVYTGSSMNGLTTIGTSDDSGSSQQSIVNFNAVAGTTYHVAVDGYLGATGPFTLNFNITPPNDNRGDAIDLIGPRVRTVGFNTSATVESGEPLHAGTRARSIWYTWTATTSGPVDVDTFGTPFDTTLAVYTGPTIGTLVPVASNDDAPSRAQSRLSFVATAGTSYVFAIDGVAGAQGTTSLRINPLDPLVPILLQPAEAAGTGDLTPRLTAQYEHADGGVVGQARFELCHAPADPGGDWSVTCPDGFQTHVTSVSLGDGSTAAWDAPSRLDLNETYVWRVRDLDSFTWSAWSAAKSFVATPSIVVDFSSLGYSDGTRTSGGAVGFGDIQPGSQPRIGPAGSGQSAPGAALELSIVSDASTAISASAPDFTRGGGGSLPIGTLAWRDATGTGETISTTSWTPFTNAPNTLEQEAPGSHAYTWWMQWTPGYALSGSYATAITMTITASP
ncbi:MAG: hypothetical protein JWM86_1788 [Thermoleophilia bacterium]|nr:hypothetical protein [Thermoleophilia bacterium]